MNGVRAVTVHGGLDDALKSLRIPDRFGMAEGVPASDILDALWAWAAGLTPGSGIASPRLVPLIGATVFEAQHGAHRFSVEIVVAGESLAECDVVVPSVGVSIELRPYRRHTSLTVLQPTLLTLATLSDWEVLERDAAVGKSPGNCLVGIVAMHQFDPVYRAPECPRHHLLYQPRPVSDEVRHHVRKVEQSRVRAATRIAASATNKEWV